MADGRISVFCPKCGWRVMDKLSPTSGEIETKCPNCRRIVRVNLSLRRKSRWFSYCATWPEDGKAG